MAFKLPELPYAHDALEPYIDSMTMHIHHGKHHNGYTNKLNAAIKDTPLAKLSIEELLSKHAADNSGVRNSGGGFYNHSLFWNIMCPGGKALKAGSALAKDIDATFGSMDGFKEAFAKAAGTRFGSGWAWLCVSNGKLEICSTPNQDNPLMNVKSNGCAGQPILGIDVWEHAYYLTYQNRRPAYVQNFFNVVNWEEVEKRYNAAKK